MKWTNEDIFISDDKNLLDYDFIIKGLHTTYWAPGRPEKTIIASFEASTALGVYDNNGQIGFARLVGDGFTFCWICDVYIDPNHRGRGLSKFLMDCVMQHPITQVKLKVLKTKNAHGLYEQYGFTRSEYMEQRS
ncbi:MAG: GNAT family N-acetyltransferase [Spirochaetales bacterium]|nr:GNAT family N-acetyltransferase [Spirochaetales bacterium]